MARTRFRLRNPLDGEVFRLALPAMGSGFTVLAHYWVDTLWVARLASPASGIAALSIGGFTIWLFAAIASLVEVGVTALVGRYSGAARLAGARYVAWQGILAAIVLAQLAAGVGWLLAPSVFEAALATPEVASAGTAYVRVYWLGGVAVLVQRAADAVFRGHGNTRAPFAIAVLGLVMNAVLDPLLLFGAGPIPALGIPGVALATVAAHLVTAVLSLSLLCRLRLLGTDHPGDAELVLHRGTPIARRRPLGVDPAVIFRILRVGLPVGASGALFACIYIAVTRIAAEAGGTAAQAGLGLGHRGEGVAFVLCVAYAGAAASLVSRRLGAGKPEEAERVAWRAVLQCGLLCAVWALILHQADDRLAALFIDEGAARAHARAYFRIVAWSLVPQAVDIVLEGAFGGAGLTIPPMIIATTLSLLRIPLAWGAAFELGLGVEGIWWTIAGTSMLRGVLMGGWFWRGTWKTRAV